MDFQKKFYIAGELREGDDRIKVVNPGSGEVVGSVASAGLADVETALNSAQAALATWARTPVSERIEWMQKLATVIQREEQHLRECLSLEMAKPWAATQEDYEMLLHSLRFYADEIQQVQPSPLEDKEGTHTHTIVRQPIGVVAAFLAWNFPLLNVAYKLGPALAAGCPIIIKPSSKTPLSAYAIGELCAEIGLPAGAVTILSGSDSLIGDAISTSTIPAMLTLIGSTNTGKHVIRAGATSIKRYSMELGGNAPVLVFPDANLDTAADVVCALKFGNTGQICVAPNRVFIHDDVYEDVKAKVLERAKAIKVGYDKDADIDMGPLIDDHSVSRVDELVKAAIADGAACLFGGAKPKGLSGSFYAPTVLEGVDDSMRIYNEEIFGPVISLMRFSDEAAVVRESNNTDVGLTAYVFTNDTARIDRLAAELEFGEIQVNGVKYAINLPHCGVKQSGVGVDCSAMALDEFLVPKRISRAL